MTGDTETDRLAMGSRSKIKQNPAGWTTRVRTSRAALRKAVYAYCGLLHATRFGFEWHEWSNALKSILSILGHPCPRRKDLRSTSYAGGPNPNMCTRNLVAPKTVSPNRDYFLLCSYSLSVYFLRMRVRSSSDEAVGVVQTFGIQPFLNAA